MHPASHLPQHTPCALATRLTPNSSGTFVALPRAGSSRTTRRGSWRCGAWGMQCATRRSPSTIPASQTPRSSRRSSLTSLSSASLASSTRPGTPEP
eukprot:2269216-Rhodomonas_salina.1